MSMTLLIPIIFALGILGIVLEDKIKINKTATALLMAILLWLVLIFDAYNIFVLQGNAEFREFLSQHPEMLEHTQKEQFISYISNTAIVYHLGDVAETLFFVMCSMLIVDIVDRHGGFHAVSMYLKTDDKRRLLWYISFAAFFFSALLDNLAAAIVLLAVLRKLVPDKTDRMKYACMIVIAANAGGSWSPIGDVTTILLWVGKNLSAIHQSTHLFVPALVNMMVPLIIAHFYLFKPGAKLRFSSDIDSLGDDVPAIPSRDRKIIFWIGILSLASVPLFQVLTNLPPFMGVLLGLVVLWIYTDLMYSHITEIKETNKLRISKLFSDIDMATILFFLGVLMSVAALETSGQLGMLSKALDTHIGQPYLISFIIGLLSSCVDNVALVAATIGMYPIQPAGADLPAIAQYFVADGGFWTFLAYCAVTGGSILIFGSATGVTVMGLEKVEFMYYTKRFTLLALLGYLCGAGVYLLFFVQ